MKILRLTLVALFVSAVTFAQEPPRPKAVPTPTKIQKAPTKQSKVTWDVQNHQFGKIEKGKPVSFDFTFTNTTDKPILLTKVKPSCGCTATKYTKTPVKPGAKGFVTATYNAASPGKFHKTIRVTTNEEGTAPKVLIIKGEVKKPQAEKKSILLK